MNWLDWTVVAAVAGYLVYLIFFRRKKGGCCGDCSACTQSCGNKKDTQR